MLPILTHLEGRMQVITIRSPLPMTDTDAAGKVTLASLLREFARRFPEQCFGFAFRPGA